VRIEAESQTQLRLLNTWDVVGDVRFGQGSSQTLGPLELARLSLSAHVSDKFSLDAELRYVALQPTDYLSLGETAYDLSVSVIGGVFRDLDDPSLMRVEGGPQLALPHLWGERGSLAVGYLFEYGWLGSRNAYVQVAVSPLPRLRLVTRVSLVEDTPSAQNPDFTSRQLAEYVSADVALTRHFYFRVGVSVFEQLGGGFVGGTDALRQDPVSSMSGTASIGGQL
jgi:hypothetical protein